MIFDNLFLGGIVCIAIGLVIIYVTRKTLIENDVALFNFGRYFSAGLLIFVGIASIVKGFKNLFWGQ